MKKWTLIPILFLLSLLSQLLILFYVRSHLEGLNSIPFPPRSLEHAQQFTKVLEEGLKNHYFMLLFFQIHSFVFFQTWCIPGTFFFNLIGGSLFGMSIGFPICLICNTLGAFLCFSMSKYLAKDVVEGRFSERISKIKAQLQSNQQNLFLYLVSLRIFPGSPNWFMNISFPHIGVKTSYFVGSILIGLTPWNYITCEAGQMILNYASNEIIIKPINYLVLGVSAIGLAILNYRLRQEKKTKGQ